MSLYADSLSVVTAIKQSSSDHPTILDILVSMHQLLETGFVISLIWIPSHCNIPGNELADAEAKLAMTSNEICEIQLRYKEYFPILRKALRDRFNAIWAAYRQNTTLKAIKDVSGKWESCIRRNRREEVVLCRLRLGHTRLTHSFIIDREPMSQCASCMCPLSVEHILVECPEFDNKRVPLLNACQRYGVPLCLKSLIGNEYIDVIGEVFEFIRQCQLLKRL